MKRFKKFLRSILRRDISPTYNHEVPMQVLIVNDETDSLTEVLGIIPERVEQLEKAVEDAFNNYQDTVLIINEVSKICKHPNELFFASYITGIIYTKMNMSMPAFFIAGRGGGQ